MFCVGGRGGRFGRESRSCGVGKEHAIHNCELFKFLPLQNHIIHLIQTTSSLVELLFSLFDLDAL